MIMRWRVASGEWEIPRFKAKTKPRHEHPAEVVRDPDFF
jgi:hypothetical protein